MNFGFIGLGKMGIAMCANMLKNKLEVVVYDKHSEPVQKLQNKGASPASSISEVAEKSEVIVLMVPDDAALTAVVDELQPTEKIVVNMGTNSLECVRAMTARAEKESFTFVNAPVAGTVKPAEDGTLVIYYGGPADALSKIQPAFDAMGKKTVDTGSQENATKYKLANNYVVGQLTATLAEAITIAEKLGLDKDDFYNAISSGALFAPFMGLKYPQIKNNDFAPAFSTEHMLKDLHFLEKALKENNYTIKSNVVKLFESTDKKFSKEDHAAVYKILQES